MQSPSLRHSILQTLFPPCFGTKHASSSYWIWLAVIALMMFLTASLPVFFHGDWSLLARPDSAGYYEPAESLLQTGSYAMQDGSPAVQRPPGYPLFLLLVRFFSGGSRLWYSLAGALLAALTLFPVAECGRRFAGCSSGLFAALCFACNLTAVANAPLILADTLLGFVCAWQTLLLVMTWRTPRLSRFAAASVCAAAASYVKPVNMLFALLVMPLLAILIFRNWRKFLIAMVLAWAVFALCTVPWMTWNARRGGDFSMDGNSGLTALHNTSAILALAENANGDDVRLRLETEAAQVFAQSPHTCSTVHARNQWFIARYREAVLAHPSAFLRTHFGQIWILLPDLPSWLENFGLTSGGRGTLAVLRRDGIAAAVSHYFTPSPADASVPSLSVRTSSFIVVLGLFLLFMTLQLYCGCAIGFCFLIWRRHWRTAALFGLPVLFYLMVPGPVLMPRYQIPALPFACTLCGAVWAALLRRKCRTAPQI